jgi:hypothetical protein
MPDKTTKKEGSENTQKEKTEILMPKIVKRTSRETGAKTSKTKVIITTTITVMKFITRKRTKKKKMNNQEESKVRQKLSFALPTDYKADMKNLDLKISRNE